MNYEQGHRAAEMMEQQGGGFLAAIALAYYRADDGNAKILRESFSHYFQEYYRRWQEKQKQQRVV